MVFCDFIEKTDKTVKYAFGVTPEDVSGEFVFDFVEKKLDIIKAPKTEDAPIRHLYRLLRMNQEEFEKGNFKKKMSYETA